MLAPKVPIISRVLETRRNPSPAQPGRVPARSRGTRSEGTPPSRSLPKRPLAWWGEKGVKSLARQKVQPSPFPPAPLPPPPHSAFLPPPQPQCHMNLYSHSEEEEPAARLSPEATLPPRTATAPPSLRHRRVPPPAPPGRPRSHPSPHYGAGGVRRQPGPLEAPVGFVPGGAGPVSTGLARLRGASSLPRLRALRQACSKLPSRAVPC